MKKRGLIHIHTHTHTTKYCTKRWKTRRVSSSTFRGFIPFINYCCSLCVDSGSWQADWFEGGGRRRVAMVRSVEKLLWIFPNLIVGPSDHWLVQRPRHHFPTIIFLVFINCGTGVKLNKNSEIEIHSNILKCDRRMDISDVVRFSQYQNVWEWGGASVLSSSLIVTEKGLQG